MHCLSVRALCLLPAAVRLSAFFRKEAYNNYKYSCTTIKIVVHSCMALKELTKAEEQVMQILWDLHKGFLKDIIEKFPRPRPAYTTVSTVIRVLVKKGFIGFKTYGKINEYFPLIDKQKYFNSQLKPMVANYLNGPQAFVSFFTNENLSLSEMEEIKKIVEEKIRKLKRKK